MYTVTQHLKLLSCILSLVFLATACTTISQQATLEDNGLEAAWVVIGEGGQASARAITRDATCPEFRQDGIREAMQVRVAASTPAQRPTVSTPELSKPSAFPVLVCEASLRADAKSAQIGGRALTLPKANPQKILIIGDTGCRLQQNSSYYQGCNDAKKWGFPMLAKTAARFQPDLVIHVGDYHYRENACPPDQALCQNSPWGYGWDTWQADFFAPAAPLLQVAPWVMVRGNHESCSRAGQGWWRFLDPRPFLQERSCDDPTFDMAGDFSAPYAVPLQPASSNFIPIRGTPQTLNAQLIIFDSSKIANKVLAKTDPAYAIYTRQLAAVDQLAQNADFSLFLNHHPILGFASVRGKQGTLEFRPGHVALQALMQNSHPERLFPAKVQATIAGHVHLFEAISFASDHPTQFVSGNGGSSLDLALPNQVPQGVTPFEQARVAQFFNSDEVGFMLMERMGDAWKVEAWNQDGKLLKRCRLQGQVTACE